MLKYVILFAAMFCTVYSQRPWHAGSGGRLPQVLPQYIDEQAAQRTQGAQGAQGAQGTPDMQGGQGVLGIPQSAAAGGIDATIANRIDGDFSNTVAVAPASGTFATTAMPYDLPVDAHGDIDLVNRIKTWPREKQPFWYINWQAIQAHRGDTNSSDQPVQPQTMQPQPNPRSFFAG